MTTGREFRNPAVALRVRARIETWASIGTSDFRDVALRVRARIETRRRSRLSSTGPVALRVRARIETSALSGRFWHP